MSSTSAIPDVKVPLARVRYSSPFATFLFKYFFPTLVCLGSSIFVTSMWKTDLEPEFKIGLALAWPVIWIGSLWSSSFLKTVEREGDHLLLTGVFKTVSVPLNEVAAVSQTYFSRTQYLTIRFKHTTAAGRRVQFIPDGNYSFSRHPAAVEIESLSQMPPAQKAPLA